MKASHGGQAAKLSDAQKIKYLRRVLRIVAARKWKNGCLVALANEALRRVRHENSADK